MAGVRRREHIFIEPGSPWDKLQAREIFCTLKEAKALIERWREHYNRVWPHSSLGYRAPAPAPVAVLTSAARGEAVRRTLSVDETVGAGQYARRSGDPSDTVMARTSTNGPTV